MPNKSYGISQNKDNPDAVFAEINNLFNITYDLMGDYLKVEDSKNLRMERQITTTITTSNVVSAPIYRNTQQVSFTRTFASTPQVLTTPINGNTSAIGAGVVSVSTTAATVALYTTTATGTGKVRVYVIGK